jgi:hypothetical protein
MRTVPRTYRTSGGLRAPDSTSVYPKTIMTIRPRSGRARRAVTAVFGGITLLSGSAWAAPFAYRPGDLLLTFRQPGAASDLVVNIGPATNYNAVPPGTSIPIPQLAPGQLTSAFASLAGLKWSVAGANRPPADPNFPLQTLWVSAGRVDPEVQSAPWLRKGQFVQGNAGSQIDGVGYNAAQASSLLPAGPDNSETAILVPISHNFAIGPVLGPDGDYAGNFQGRVEAVTPDDFFAESSSVSRADLYELLPGTSAEGSLNAPGRHLGFFELKPDGALTFQNPAAISQPRITRVTRSGDVTTLSFSTTPATTYRLRATNSAGLPAPISSWAAGATVTGDGSVKTLEDNSPDNDRFFVIEVVQ